MVKCLHIYTSRFVENLTYSLYKQLSLHFTCKIYTRQVVPQDIQNLPANEFFLFISPQSTISKSALDYLVPNTYFIYQTEQLNTKERAEKFHKNIYMNKVLQNACAVFDYSQKNMELYTPYYVNPPLYLPFLPCKCKIDEVYDKTIDILFYGSINQRRYIIIEVLRQLLPDLRIEVDEQLFGIDLTKKITQSKIIVNIHNYEHSTLETARLMEALMYNTHIISEKTNEPELLNKFPSVHFIDELIGYDVIDAIDVEKSTFDNIIEIIHKCLKETKCKHIIPVNNISKTVNIFKKQSFITECQNIMPILKKRNQLYNYEAIFNNSSVFIEFRVLPHSVSIILNMMQNFPHWHHTIVCNHNNKALFENIVLTYNQKLHLIILDKEITSVNDYNNLLITESFWNQFTYDHILLYQEDSFLLHNNINKFLDYDYVGAPWPHEQNVNNMGVGNGGFSLRKVSTLIKCFHKITPEQYKNNINENVKKYMSDFYLENVPEDVYFSSIIHDEKMGIVAPYNIAQEFALESSEWPLKKPMGIHQYWNFHNKYYPMLKQIFLYSDYFKEATHRGGWNKIVNYGLQNSLLTTINSMNDIYLIDSLEKYFIWENNALIQQPWIGIIHYTNCSIPYYKDHQHVDNILQNENFLASLSNCVGLVCLSSKLVSYVNTYLKNENATCAVYCIKHPILMGPIAQDPFNVHHVVNHGAIIQLGQQYRITSFIYRLKTTRKKIWLPGCEEKQAYDSLATECTHFNYSINIKDVQIGRVSEKKYDELLINNIVVIPLFSASANNSLLEIIALNVPAFIIYDDAVAEYIGKDYPLFIESMEQMETILNNAQLLTKKLNSAHEYLKIINKDVFHIRHFYKELYNIAHSV